MRGLFITGTGTEVGKTYVAALIATDLRDRGVRVGVYKPAASGCHDSPEGLVSDDALALWEAAGRPLTLDAVCPQRFAAPLAPNVAARKEGLCVDPDLLRSGVDPWRGACDVLLVEGAGGLMSPLSDDDYNLDLAVDLGLPLVVVSANRLGVINDTLQTLITASVAGAVDKPCLEIAGVVLNDVTENADVSRLSNAAEIASRSTPPLLACVPWGSGFDRDVDWNGLATDEHE